MSPARDEMRLVLFVVDAGGAEHEEARATAAEMLADNDYDPEVLEAIERLEAGAELSDLGGGACVHFRLRPEPSGSAP